MANGKPNRPIRPRGGGPKGRRRVVIDQGGGRPGQGQRQRPGIATPIAARASLAR